MRPLPSPSTKDVASLSYPLTPDLSLILTQSQADHEYKTTGTTLWLSAQVLAAFLLDSYPSSKGKGKRAVDLGAGVGLIGLTLAHLGFDCLVTDVPFVLTSVLSPNVRRNLSSLPSSARLAAKELDWTIPSSSWDWTQPDSVTSSWTSPHSPSISSSPTIEPPFDLIVTTDTIYEPSLLPSLLSTLRSISLLSSNPPILLALERRDSKQVDDSLAQAKEAGFACTQVARGRVAKVVDRFLGWEKEDWDGVEIWKMRYRGGDGS